MKTGRTKFGTDRRQIFAAWVEKCIVVLRLTGITWTPLVDQLNNNAKDALEHVSAHFASWTRSRTQTESQRSGNASWEHALSQEQLRDRTLRARID